MSSRSSGSRAIGSPTCPDSKMGRSLNFKICHNRLLLSLAEGMGHDLSGRNLDFCGDGGAAGPT